MSFTTEAAKDGRGRVIRVDISLDGFSTIAYRYGDVAGALDGTNLYAARVLELGPVHRGFGQGRIAASSSTTLSLANADGALDWLCGNTGLASAAAARFRVYVALYDPAASPLTFSAKLLGEFVLSGWPRQDNTTVSLSLADDMMGKLGPGLQLPNFVDWQAVGNAGNNPIYNGIGIPDSVSTLTPIQLAFGEDWLLAHPHVIPVGNNAGGDTYRDKLIVPLYCTTDTGAVSQDLVQQLRVERYHLPESTDAADGVPELFEVPRTITDFALGSSTPDTLTVWSVEKSPTITKAGRSFQIVYLVVRTDVGNRSLFYAAVADATLRAQYLQFISKYKYAAGYQQSDVDSDDAGSTGPDGGNGGSYATLGSRVMRWHVKGIPLSQRTNAPTVFPGTHAIDVMVDLCSVYSDATIDTTSAARVKAGNPNARAFGVVQAWSERANNQNLYQPPMSLRQVLTQLAQSSDMDVFINWAGAVAFSSDVWDYLTSTQYDINQGTVGALLEIQETELQPGSMRRWVPSNGERHSAFNRVYFEGGRNNPADGRGGSTLYAGIGGEGIPFQGPWDLSGATIPVTTRVIEMALQQGWRPWRQQREDPLQWRSIDIVARDRISFRMHRGGLLLDLGDYFKLNWTRGASIGSPYASTVFQCEDITYAPGDDTVEIEAVWRHDVTTERQYLLDDETLLVRSKGALTGSATPDGASSASFGGTIDLNAMGVLEGDILVLRDTSQAADVFTRNGAWRIIAVSIGGTDCDLANNGEGNQPAAGVVVNAEWYIVRGATTYPTAVSDPTNYPDGGAMYGKVTDSGGLTSDAAAGNRLISG